MRLERVHHLGVLVEELSGPLQALRDYLGLPLDHVERYGEELEIAFMPCGDTIIELIEPLTEQGWNADDLKDKGPHIQHVAFQVGDVRAALDELAEAGVEPLGEAPRTGAGGTTIAFLQPEAFAGILVELVEVPPHGG